VTGAIAATGAFNVHLMAVTLIVAAILGDSTNYQIGKFLGIKVLSERIQGFSSVSIWSARMPSMSVMVAGPLSLRALHRLCAPLLRSLPVSVR